jgi:hypothetical protein
MLSQNFQARIVKEKETSQRKKINLTPCVVSSSFAFLALFFRFMHMYFLLLFFLYDTSLFKLLQLCFALLLVDLRFSLCKKGDCVIDFLSLVFLVYPTHEKFKNKIKIHRVCTTVHLQLSSLSPSLY